MRLIATARPVLPAFAAAASSELPEPSPTAAVAVWVELVVETAAPAGGGGATASAIHAITVGNVQSAHVIFIASPRVGV
jgi:hypothetical protein